MQSPCGCTFPKNRFSVFVQPVNRTGEALPCDCRHLRMRFFFVSPGKGIKSGKALHAQALYHGEALLYIVRFREKSTVILRIMRRNRTRIERKSRRILYRQNNLRRPDFPTFSHNRLKLCRVQNPFPICTNLYPYGKTLLHTFIPQRLLYPLTAPLTASI